MRSAFFLIILSAVAVGSGYGLRESPASAPASPRAVASTTAAAPAKQEWVEFNGQRLVLAFEAKNQVESFKEYIPAGEKLDSWKQFAALREYPGLNDAMSFAQHMADLLKRKNPDYQSAIQQNNKTGEVMIDFVMWPADGTFVEFNVFKFRKGENGGIVAQQYAVRAYENQRDFMKGLGALRDKLCELMAKDGLTISGQERVVRAAAATPTLPATGSPPAVASTIEKGREAAEQGNAKAQFDLARRYAQGLGVEQNWTEAAKWYRKSAEQGDAEAQANLGVCYYKGNGVEQDKAEAIRWMVKAADQGFATAQQFLGIAFATGDGVKQDWAESVKWYRRAADQGLAIAECDLGVCYLLGNGVEQDAKEGTKWLRKAADQGDEVAQVNLGICYQTGTGVEKNDNEAIKLFRLAANQGNAEARERLTAMGLQ